MNKTKSAVTIFMTASLAFTASPAMAQPRNHGWDHGQGWGGPVRCEDLNSRRDRRECEERRRGNPNNNDDIGAAIGAGIIGLTLGAIIAGAASEQDKQQKIQEYDRWTAYCSAKYRSFDVRTGTFLGNDGRRHVCQ